MEFVAATVLFPLLLAALALGGGLLVDRAVRGAVPGVLLPVIGLATLVVAAELCTFQEATAKLVPFAFVLVAVAGFLLGWRRLRSARPDPWMVAASVGVYVMVCAPVLLHGDVTLAGYLLDTTVAFHLAGSDYLLEHARNFERLPASSFRTTMENYFGTQYPGGGQTLLGGSSRLVGVAPIWLYQPLMAMLLAFCAAPLYYMARAASLARPAAGITALVCAAPALVYAYAQMGAIKELTALPFILSLGPVLLLTPRLLRLGIRGALVPAVVGAAGVGAIGLAFMPWLGLTVLAGLVLILVGPERTAGSWKPLAAWGAALVAGLVVLAVPTFGPLGDSLTLAKSLTTSNAAAVADPGNLVRPLLPEQMAGIWLGGSHRVDPAHLDVTYALIGIALVAAILGALYLVRTKRWDVAAFVAVVAVVWIALTIRGTTWTDAKLLVITSPVVVLVVAIGVHSLGRAGRRLEALAVGAALVLGVLGSNAFAYHDTNVAPTERYRELIAIGEDHAGEGPTLVPEFDEFALYALSDMAPSGPGFSYKPAAVATLRDGAPTGYGGSYDVDSLAPGVVDGYSTIVARRRPDSSRPPANFRLAERGRYYDVWRRTDTPVVLVHAPAGRDLQPADEIACGRIAALSRQAARAGASLWYVPRRPVIAIDARALDDRPAGWPEIQSGVALGSPGFARKRFNVRRAGVYDVWLRGDIARSVRVSVDGREVGSVSQQTGNEGNYAGPMAVELSPGIHTLQIERGGGGPGPGDGAPGRLVAVVLEPNGADRPPVRRLDPGDGRRLCGSRVDWIDVAKPAG